MAGQYLSSSRSRPTDLEISIQLSRNKTLIHNSTHSAKKRLKEKLLISALNAWMSTLKMKRLNFVSFLFLHYLATSVWIECEEMFLHSTSGGHILIFGCVCSMEDRNTTFLKYSLLRIKCWESRLCLASWHRRRATIIPDLHVSREPSLRQITSFTLLFYSLTLRSIKFISSFDAHCTPSQP